MMSSLPSEAEARKILDDERSGQAVMEDFLEGEADDLGFIDTQSEDDAPDASSQNDAAPRVAAPTREGIDGPAAAPTAATDTSMNSQAAAAAPTDVAVRVAGPATPSRGVSTLGRAAPAVDSLALCSGRTGSVTQLPLIAGKGELVLGYGSEYSPMPEVAPMGTRLVSRQQVLLLRGLDGSLRAVSIGRNPSAVVTSAGAIISLEKGAVCCPSRN